MHPDEYFYQEALRELLEKRVVEGVFARAFADADGDANRTRARYIQIRASQLAEVSAAAAVMRRQEAAEAAAARARAVARLANRLGDTIRFIDDARHIVSSAPIDRVVEDLHHYMKSGGYFDCETKEFESFQLFARKLEEESRREGQPE